MLEKRYRSTFPSVGAGFPVPLLFSKMVPRNFTGTPHFEIYFVSLLIT